ncbi:hypothetical protein AMS68_004426 [Peltaster fructicola]|uniref:RWD domain-containing protein n=1 Tax=Peltaster fructicola TaxID=286661 RepID=A0A6H0XWB6_9PEZI|nr:hypothetical protein AMS68_004426 [Peltaster fructicola]
MQDATEQDERLKVELSMLEAMYPENMRWLESRREVVFTDQELSASLSLRIPEDYLVSALPEILTATVKKHDLRNEMQAKVKQCDVGIEILDLLLDAFKDMASMVHAESTTDAMPCAVQAEVGAMSTVVVWLHHLLNTNKRKQALSPPIAGVSGVTKPGYPGVLVYSGPAHAVAEHVAELKSLNWQAFQIRLETEEEWSFQHGAGVVEVGSMAELVAEIGTNRKQDFLQAVHIA